MGNLIFLDCVNNEYEPSDTDEQFHEYLQQYLKDYLGELEESIEETKKMK